MLQLTKPPPPAPGKAAAPPAPALKSWDQVLHDCGFPTTVLVIDFETYFDADYGMGSGTSALSTIEYVMDPRFEVLGMATGFIYRSERLFDWFEGPATNEFLWRMMTQIERGHLTILAQNLAFDAMILERRFNVRPKYMIDLLGLARHQNARQKNDLGSLCKQYGLKDKGDTAEFKGATFRTDRFRRPKGRGPKMPQKISPMDPGQAAALKEYALNDAEREWDLFTRLLPKLSNPAVELRLIQHTIELFTRPTLRVDFEKGADLIVRMDAQVDAAIDDASEAIFDAGHTPCLTREDISGNKSFEHALNTALIAAGDVPQKYHKLCKETAARPNGMMLALAKSDDEREELLNHPDPAVKALMAARVAVKSWPLHIARVNRIMQQAKADGGRLPVPLKYHGAHTGRASGGEKINLQNLGSRGDPLISEVREMIVAPEGHELVMVDAAAIEARVLAWIAGQWDLVEKFQNGEEIYCGFASKVLGFPVRKPRKEGGIAAVEQRMGWARNSVGKIGILGCGYGMGADKTCAYAKGAIDFATAAKIVQTYRAENKQIVKFWYALERAFTYTAKYRKPCTMERGLSFRCDPDCDVVIGLPNGRELHYPKVRITPEGLEVYNAMMHTWEHTWGGTLTENIVQAMSRDVLMEAMLRLEDRGHHTALHVHDELVMVVKKGAGEFVNATAIRELSKTPDWAPRLALAAEGCVSGRYGKH